MPRTLYRAFVSLGGEFVRQVLSPSLQIWGGAKMYFLDLVKRSLTLFCLIGGLIALAGYAYIEQQVYSLTSEINSLSATAASEKASRAVMTMTITDALSVISQATADIETACRLSRLIKDPALMWNVCPSTPGSAHRTLAKFQLIYFNAVSSRLSENYARSAKLFQQAVNVVWPAERRHREPVPSNFGIPDEWVVRALEGLAYSEFRLHELSNANEDASLAQTFSKPYHGFVFADTTALKIVCVERSKSAEQIRSTLAQIRSKYDTMIRSSSGTDNCFARLDRSTIEQDDELFLDCRAAGLQPMKINGPPSC